jgi:hypothetical protein
MPGKRNLREIHSIKAEDEIWSSSHRMLDDVVNPCQLVGERLMDCVIACW